MLDYLRLRAISDVEWIANETYSRVIEMEGCIGTIRLSHEPAKTARRVDVWFPSMSFLAAITAQDLLSRAEHRRPWRACAVLHLWAGDWRQPLRDGGIPYASVA
jgi:hypothetical protein